MRLSGFLSGSHPLLFALVFLPGARGGLDAPPNIWYVPPMPEFGEREAAFATIGTDRTASDLLNSGFGPHAMAQINLSEDSDIRLQTEEFSDVLEELTRIRLEQIQAPKTTSVPVVSPSSAKTVIPWYSLEGLAADEIQWYPPMAISPTGTTTIYDPTARPTPMGSMDGPSLLMASGEVLPFTGTSIGAGMVNSGSTLNLGGGVMTMMGRLGGRMASKGVLVSGAAAWAATRGLVGGLASAAGGGRVSAIFARLPGPLKAALKFTGAVIVWDAVTSMLGDSEDGPAIAEVAALIEDGIGDGSIMFRGGTDRFGQPVVPKYLTIGPLDGNNTKAWIHDRYYSSKSIASVKRRTDTAWFRGRRGGTARRRKG